MIDFLLQIDRQLFLFLNGLNHPVLDEVMIFSSAKLSWLPLYIILLFLIIRQFKWQSVLILILVAVLISISDQLSVRAFKLVFERPRPCHEADLQPLIHLAAGRCGGAFGFVSSHAANSFALATFIWILFRGKYLWMGYLMFSYAALVSYSRIYLGVHYPGDILAGGLLGFFAGWFVYAIYVLWGRFFCRQSC
jgi:undecaprenyl-diphosphatase